MLNILIPTYKNKKGLRQTLQSIDYKNPIIVNVIDDASGLDYSDIQQEFPQVNFFFSKENTGPGVARQTLIDITNEPFFTFIDTGDYFLNNEVQKEIISTLETSSDKDIFSWQYINEHNNKPSTTTNNRLHSRVFRRAAIAEKNIRFCPEGSYINEDIGFNRACRLLIPQEKWFLSHTPVIMWTYNESSLSQSLSFYKHQTLGLALNEEQVINLCEKSHIPRDALQKEADEIMAFLYYLTCKMIKEKPEFKQNAYAGALYFYDKVYYRYADTPSPTLQSSFYRFARLVKYPMPNIKYFIKDLKNKTLDFSEDS